jgi:hypothetical protein
MKNSQLMDYMVSLHFIDFISWGVLLIFATDRSLSPEQSTLVKMYFCKTFVEVSNPYIPDLTVICIECIANDPLKKNTAGWRPKLHTDIFFCNFEKVVCQQYP